MVTERHNDPGRRYSSLADKTLHISRAAASDSGTYFCNNEAAAELTVVPSGTLRLNATKKTSVTLTCPHDAGGSAVPTWRKDTGRIQKDRRFSVSAFNKTLTLRHVKPGDSGLYYCDGRPAAYLDVTKGRKAPPTIVRTTTRQTALPSTPEANTVHATNAEKTTTPPTTSPPSPTASTAASPPPTTTTTTTASSTNTTTQKPYPEHLGLVFGMVVLFLLLLFIIIIIIYFAWRCRFRKQGIDEKHPVYDEIQDVFEFRPAHESLATTSTYCMAEFPDGSNQNEPTYSTIPYLPRVEKTGTFPPNESPYRLIDNTSLGGNNKGSTQLSDNTYFLLEKPKVPGNNNDPPVV